MHSQLPSISGGHLLHLQPEDAPFHGNTYLTCKCLQTILIYSLNAKNFTGKFNSVEFIDYCAV
jgi:hypothetical protein